MESKARSRWRSTARPGWRIESWSSLRGIEMRGQVSDTTRNRSRNENQYQCMCVCVSLYLIPPNVASWWRPEAGSSSSGSSWWRCPWSFLLFLFHVEPRSTITPLLATFSTVPRSSSFEISSSITGWSYGSIGGKPRGVSTANCLRRWLNRSRNREREGEREKEKER